MVLGPIDSLRQLLGDHAIDEVIVAFPDDCLSTLRDHVLECRRMQLPVRKVPYIRDMLLPGGGISLTDFSVEDLLRRRQIEGGKPDIAGYVRGKRVLVTGAGGSIGSELCRQIARQSPASLILLGRGENSIFAIHQELLADYPETAERSHCVIAHVSHRKRMAQVLEQYAPQVVFHAAAHKHVPMMETNCQEAVFGNVFGTSSVVEACGRSGVERMVTISTDKAVDPCCIMGATKWLAEETVLGGAETWKGTSFVTVRFGNVLGSRGSMVPLFREQIRRGGPVTVTHPDMTRYFMTIPEAVRLVLQAGAIGESGELYLLDMGDPVNVLDLAKDMICLSGLRPGVDIPIEFTGLRAGERLHERLVSADEQINKSRWPGLFNVKRGAHFTTAELHSALTKLQDAASNGDDHQVRLCLQELAPTFRCEVAAATARRPESRAEAALVDR
jgi:FlaA1/EpsC-like NDP-sugar epimerase